MVDPLGVGDVEHIGGIANLGAAAMRNAAGSFGQWLDEDQAIFGELAVDVASVEDLLDGVGGAIDPSIVGHPGRRWRLHVEVARDAVTV